MKKIAMLSILLALTVLPDPFLRNNILPPFTGAEMKLRGGGAEEIRAREYEARYLYCDEHHNCSRPAAAKPRAAVWTEKGRAARGSVFPFMPVWQ